MPPEAVATEQAGNATATSSRQAAAEVDEQPHSHSDAVSTSNVISRIQQDMAHLTMLLSSRNLWMRPAVLEAPAQDPQYLEAIHKVGNLYVSAAVTACQVLVSYVLNGCVS